jgi:diguanylate cyclase (GGDEF)-like protein
LLVRWHASLGTKFVLLTMGVLVVTLTIVAAVNYASQRELLRTHLEAKGQVLGSFVARIAPEALHNFDFILLDDYMRNATRIKDVVYGVVLDQQGRNLTAYLDYGNQRIGDAVQRVADPGVQRVVEAVSAQPGVVTMRFPIVVGGDAIGTVQFGIDTEDTERLGRAEMAKWLLANVLVILFLSFAIYLVFRRHALRPIQELTAGAQRVAAGELARPVNVEAGDELGALAESFNVMMGKLDRTLAEKDDALRALQDVNRTLEERVATRTSELEAVNRELEHMALHDSLSGLPNRALFTDRLEQAIIAAGRSGGRFACMILDLDRFKEINDTLGHNIGDEVLREIASRLARGLRESDTVARLGGDEFAILLPSANVREATRIASKLLHLLEEPVVIGQHSFAVGASIGVALFPDHGERAAQLMQRADVAMYVAKRNGNGYALYDVEEDHHNASRLAFLSELRGALDRGELALHFQPKVHLASAAVQAVEALVRWQHPQRGLILPEEYIPLSEQTGLIRPITTWVLGEAMRQCREWHAAGRDLAVSVNLSMRNLHDPQFPGTVGALLMNWQVDPQAIVLEITESAVMADSERVLAVLQRLRGMGVRLSIDDFGTGHSSLSHLKRLPVSEIKIDKSFVTDMHVNDDDAIIVRSTIDLAHNLGLTVTAEGVEREDAFTVLNVLGCDLAQGQYISPALPVRELEEWLGRSAWGQAADRHKH